MCFGLLQTRHGNSGVETAGQSKPSQPALNAGSTGAIDKERALPSLDTKYNQTVSGIVQTSIFPPESHNRSASVFLQSLSYKKST